MLNMLLMIKYVYIAQILITTFNFLFDMWEFLQVCCLSQFLLLVGRDFGMNDTVDIQRFKDKEIFRYDVICLKIFEQI